MHAQLLSSSSTPQQSQLLASDLLFSSLLSPLSSLLPTLRPSSFLMSEQTNANVSVPPCDHSPVTGLRKAGRWTDPTQLDAHL